MSDRHRVDQLRRVRVEVDHEQLVVRLRPSSRCRPAYGHDRVGDQADLAVRGDLQVGRRPEQGVGERQAGADAGLGGLRDVEHQQLVGAGLDVLLALFGERDLRVQADQEIMGSRARRGGQRKQGRRTGEQDVPEGHRVLPILGRRVEGGRGRGQAAPVSLRRRVRGSSAASAICGWDGCAVGAAAHPPRPRFAAGTAAPSGPRLIRRVRDLRLGRLRRRGRG